MSNMLNNTLHTISAGLQSPTVVILLLLIFVTLVMLGSLIAEAVTERRRMKAKIPELIDDIQGKEGQALLDIIRQSGLLKRQKASLEVLINHSALPTNTLDALARRLLFEEQTHYDKITKVTDLISRIAPMFGLMGTLIPLGPGLIALGQGDTKTLADSMLIAFDTTVAGLISAAVCFVISGIRKRWYENYLTAMEAIMESILEAVRQSA